MAKQTIGIGTTANDGTGDSIRVSFDKVNDNTNEVYTLFGDGSTLAISGDATVSAGALTIANDAITTVKVLDDNITTAKLVDNAITTAKITDANVTAAKIADDSISFEKVDAEFTTASALTAGATVDVDFDAAQVFTLTPNANTTFNITNPKIGVTKTIIVTGAGSSYTANTWTVGGSSGTFNKIAGDYDDTSSTKNLYQITCVSATEFWYSISQIAS
jgi:hypothetical protein